MRAIKGKNRRGVTLLELLVASIGAFAVLGGLMGLYMTSLLMYRSATRTDQRLSASGQLEALLNHIGATCPMERMRIINGPGPLQPDGFPPWRALAYERLSAHAFLDPFPVGAPPYAMRNPFTTIPAASRWYPRVQQSTVNRETGLIFWWRDLNTYNPAQNRFMESRIYHLRTVIQRGNQPAGVPNHLRVSTMFNQAGDSFSDLTDAAIGGLIGDLQNRQISQVIAEDVLEFVLELDGTDPVNRPQDRVLRWRYDGYRGP